MSSKKRQRREDEIVEQVAKHHRLSTEQSVISSKPDVELFVVDRLGSKSARAKINKIETVKASGNPISITERNLIAKITKRLNNKNNVDDHVIEDKLVDIWQDEGKVEMVQSSRNTRSKTSSIKVALPGQSYNPSFTEHQDALAEAVALEIIKLEKDMKNSGTIDGTISELTRSIMKNEDDSDSESDEENEENEENNQNGEIITNIKKKKLKTKLTRAQRNKIKARNIRRFEESQSNTFKKIVKSIGNVPAILKQIRITEETNKTNKELIEFKKVEDSKSIKMTYEEAASIPLSDELQGTLRQLIPKGSVINNQVANMRASGDLMARDRRNRKAYEKPHTGKKIKWVARQKYV